VARRFVSLRPWSAAQQEAQPREMPVYACPVDVPEPREYDEYLGERAAYSEWNYGPFKEQHPRERKREA